MTLLFVMAEDSFWREIGTFGRLFIILLLIGAVPALFTYLSKRIGSAISDRQDWSKTSNPLENYETELSKYYYTKEVRRCVLIRTLPIQLLLFVGIALMIIGTYTDNEQLGGWGFISFISFFGVYGYQFYHNGGWKNAGEAFDKYAAKYKPKEYVTEEIYEYWDDMPSSSRRLVETRTYDKNAYDNFLTFLMNLPILIMKISMSVTYISLFIIDDLVMTIRYTIFYAFQKKASLKKAKKYYETTIQISAERGFLIPARIYEDDSANKIPNEINARYLEASLQSVKRGDQSFLLFVSDLPRENEVPHYLALNVSKKIAKVEMFGNKELHIYETDESRVYVGTTIGSNDTSVENYFSTFVIPFIPSNEFLQSVSMLPSDDIRYFIAAQSVYLRYMIEHEPLETEVSLIHFDAESGSAFPVVAKLSDIILGEGDEQFTYQISEFTPSAICESESNQDFDDEIEHINNHAPSNEPRKNPPKQKLSFKLIGLLNGILLIFLTYQLFKYFSSTLESGYFSTLPIAITLPSCLILIFSIYRAFSKLTFNKHLSLLRKAFVLLFSTVFWTYTITLFLIYVSFLTLTAAWILLGDNTNPEFYTNPIMQEIITYANPSSNDQLTVSLAIVIIPLVIMVILSIFPKIFAREGKR